MVRQATLTLHAPQPLSYAQAVCSNKETVNDFFPKLGFFYGQLNLIAKPNQLYDVDETGVTNVHHPSKVIAQIGWHNVPSVLACISASGLVIPPFMVYARKQPVPEMLREGPIQT